MFQQVVGLILNNDIVDGFVDFIQRTRIVIIAQLFFLAQRGKSFMGVFRGGLISPERSLLEEILLNFFKIRNFE